MDQARKNQNVGAAGREFDGEEAHEWLEAFEQLVREGGHERGRFILDKLLQNAMGSRLHLPAIVQTPYVNTLKPEDTPTYPGDERIEQYIRAIVRWNAMALVLRASHHDPTIGGHLATYASAATLYEVGFNHFFRGRDNGQTGDHVFFQGHASPGIYARAFLEGRLTAEQMEHFRREVGGQGLSSYPHPWLMPDFWEFPTVSMGLGPLAATMQARFNRYLRDRGIKDTDDSRVWCFVGDGECDQPETLAALSLAAREGLDNLIFVINCNLQRLDGPVRGNGKIIQELEAVFRGAGWNVIKVIWGRDWNPLLSQDKDGILVKRMTEAVDGDYQRYAAEPGSFTREHFFGTHPFLRKLVEPLTDDQIKSLRRGGHDARKMYAAYYTAVRHKGSPTVILAKTIKGWTLGESVEGRNVAHQQKKFSEEQLKKFRDLLKLPIPDEQLKDPPFYKPPEDSVEMQYLRERRKTLGGHVPRRVVRVSPEPVPALDYFKDLLGEFTVDMATTKAFVRMLHLLLKHETLGKRIVPIIPDEARTFGLDALFKQYGIYSRVGQLYEPVDHHLLISYREAKDGQMIEEGICEAGAMGTFTAAGTAYATHGVNMIPFYIFYSMFGFQRTGDQIWALGDARGKGFLMGATAGRTTLHGEGLQHQDGHSQIMAGAVPNIQAYDPAFAYELAVILQNGLKRMYEDMENVFYYITVYNEMSQMPAMPPGVAPGILKGLYLLSPAAKPKGKQKSVRAQLLGSGTLLREALRAQQILAERYGVGADVWSATSYLNMRRDALACERWNMLHPDQKPRVPFVVSQLGPTEGPVVAVTDFMKAVPDQIARWLPGRFTPLGTDGFGRSDTRAMLRRFFEVDAECITLATLHQLAQQGAIPKKVAAQAIKDLDIDPDKLDPAVS